MFLVSLLRRIAFSYYDYKAYNFNIEKTGNGANLLI